LPSPCMRHDFVARMSTEEANSFCVAFMRSILVAGAIAGGQGPVAV